MQSMLLRSFDSSLSVSLSSLSLSLSLSFSLSLSLSLSLSDLLTHFHSNACLHRLGFCFSFQILKNKNCPDVLALFSQFLLIHFSPIKLFVLLLLLLAG